MQDHFISSSTRSERNTLFNSSSCVERISFASQGGSTAKALWLIVASQRFAFRKLTDRVIIVIVIVRMEDAEEGPKKPSHRWEQREKMKAHQAGTCNESSNNGYQP